MLYTGKGDSGTTKVFGPDARGRGSDLVRRSCDQQRISKSSELPEALGALDELNAYLGFAKMRAKDAVRIAKAIRTAQENLFIIQAQTAGADKKLATNAAEEMEELIGEIEKEIPPITGFSIAGGTELSAILDVARTFARRAERRLIAVEEVGLRTLLPETKTYMNRLSSLLFALARLANHEAGILEENPRY